MCNIDQKSVDTLGRYVDRHVGRHVDRLSADTTPYFTATRPILYRHWASTTLTTLDTDFYFLYSNVKQSFLALRGAFSSRRPFLTFQSYNVHLCHSSSYVFSSSSSLLYNALVIFFK